VELYLLLNFFFSPKSSSPLCSWSLPTTATTLAVKCVILLFALWFSFFIPLSPGFFLLSECCCLLLHQARTVRTPRNFLTIAIHRNTKDSSAILFFFNFFFLLLLSWGQCFRRCGRWAS
jgi:hypothetical protein